MLPEADEKCLFGGANEFLPPFTLPKLEQPDVPGDEFATELATFQTVIAHAHAEAEEQKELPAVAGQLDAQHEGEMVAALSQVQELAVRQHPAYLWVPKSSPGPLARDDGLAT